MFNSYAIKTTGLSALERAQYESRMDELHNHLRESVTPDQLRLADDMSSRFKQSLVEKHLPSTSRNIVGFTVWQSWANNTVGVSLLLNNQPITIELDSTLLYDLNPEKVESELVHRLATEIAKRISPEIVCEMFEKMGKV